jgi:hypothetical protein
VYATGETAHIDTIFKFLPHTRQHGCIDNLHCCDDSVNCSHHARMIFSAGGSFAYFAQTYWCDIPTHKTTTSPPERPFSQYIYSNRLTAEM